MGGAACNVERKQQVLSESLSRVLQGHFERREIAGSAGSDHNMVNRAWQILKERLQGSRIVGIEGRGALGAEFARRLFESVAIASGEDDAGALSGRRAVSRPMPALPPMMMTVWRSSSGPGRVRMVEAEALMTPPIERFVDVSRSNTK
jgi:hypothetical protein